MFSQFQMQKIEEIQDRFEKALKKEKILKIKKQKIDSFVTHHMGASSDFIQEKLESIELLEKERKKLISLIQHPAFPNYSPFQERLSSLSKNKMIFLEGAMQTKGKIKESHHKLKNTCQIDETDLKKILSLVEDVSIDEFVPFEKSPQCIIQELKLKKGTSNTGAQHFEMQLEIFQREFLNP